MSEPSRSQAPWVIGLVAVIGLLGCCISGAGGVFLFRYRQEEQRQAVERARDEARMRELPTEPAGVLPPSGVPGQKPPAGGSGARPRAVEPPTCEFLIPDESFEDYQRRCPEGRASSGHAPGTVGECEEPLRGETFEDYQRRCLGGAAGGDPRVSIQAVVETAFGASLPVRVGQTCTLVVENPERADAVGGRWCRAEVRCGDAVVYGGGTAGYFPCTFSTQPPAVIGEDAQASSVDQDGVLELDTNAGRLTVRDDATGRLGTFLISARITSAR